MQEGKLSEDKNVRMFSSKFMQHFNSADPKQNYKRMLQHKVGRGGVVETKSAEQDGQKGVERMGIRRQVRDRVAEVEKTRDMRTGQIEERRQTRNVADDDFSAFEKEWDFASKLLPPSDFSFARIRGLPPSGNRKTRVPPRLTVEWDGSSVASSTPSSRPAPHHRMVGSHGRKDAGGFNSATAMRNLQIRQG